MLHVEAFKGQRTDVSTGFHRFSYGTTGKVHTANRKLDEEEEPVDRFSPLHGTLVGVVVSCIIDGIKRVVGVKWHLSWVERLAIFFY